MHLHRNQYQRPRRSESCMRQQKCVSILSIMTKQVGIKGIVRLVLTGTGGGISPSGRP